MNGEKDIQIFCENLKKLRLEFGYSKKKMAEILNIGIKTLTTIENGMIPPRLNCEILFQIYTRFGIRPSDIFDEDLMKKF